MRVSASEAQFKGKRQRVTGHVAINYWGGGPAAEQEGIFNYLSVDDIIEKVEYLFSKKKKKHKH